MMIPFVYKIVIGEPVKDGWFYDRSISNIRSIFVFAFSEMRALNKVWVDCGDDEIVLEVYSVFGSRRLV